MDPGKYLFSETQSLSFLFVFLFWWGFLIFFFFFCVGGFNSCMRSVEYFHKMEPIHSRLFQIGSQRVSKDLKLHLIDLAYMYTPKSKTKLLSTYPSLLISTDDV